MMRGSSGLIKNVMLIICLFFFVCSSPALAAKLPNQTPENQAFQVDTVLDATGMITEDTGMNWAIVSPGSLPTGILGPGQSIALLDYSDHIRTNGGKISERKNFRFDSKDKTDPLRNLNTEKLLTYAGSDGAHLEGEEALSLDVAGNFSPLEDTVRCVFMTTPNSYVPAFCTKVTAKSELVSVNRGQVSTKGESLAVADSIDDPLVLSYRIAVTPDKNSDFADGTVRTFLSMGVMEARSVDNDTWNKAASMATWTDKSVVTGGIRNFQKDYGDPSGFQSGFFSPVGDNGPTRVPTAVQTPAPQTGSVKFHVTQIGTSPVSSVTAKLDGNSLGNLPGSGSAFEGTFSGITPGHHTATISTSPESVYSSPQPVDVTAGGTAQADFTSDYTFCSISITIENIGAAPVVVSVTLDSDTRGPDTISTTNSRIITYTFGPILKGVHSFSIAGNYVWIYTPPPATITSDNIPIYLNYLVATT